MLILGIDPGIATTGCGIVEERDSSLVARYYGVVLTESKWCMPDRLQKVYSEITQLIGEYRPDAVAVEELFFCNNAKSAIAVGQARGVALLAAVNTGLPVYEYTPLQVKQALTGYGRADKDQVGKMVKTLLGLKEIPRPDDAADALAIAICHLFSAKHLNAMQGSQ
jgi:crossover junction endodeoxyribonuclease RuvC